MPSKNDIANQAALLLGQTPNISDFPGEASDRAIVQSLAVAFESCLPALLEQHPWKFLKHTVDAVADAVAPQPSRFDIAVTLEADCLQVVCLGTDDPQSRSNHFEVKQGMLYCAGVLGAVVRYTYLQKISDTTRYSAGFAKALATAMARDCVIAVTGSAARWEQAEGRCRA